MKKLTVLSMCIAFLSMLSLPLALASSDSSSDDHAKKFKADRAGHIAGTINYCGIGGLAGTTVYIPGKSFMAITGASGEFTLHYVPTGTYNLVFSQNGQIINTVPDVAVTKKSFTQMGVITICPDSDGDLFDASVDCDDSNPSINPAAAEICGDGIDNNCSGLVDEGCITCTDADEDGFFAQTTCGTTVDCDDSNASVNPIAEEACFDGLDNNCDGTVDENCLSCVPLTACGTTTSNIGACSPGTYDNSCNCVGEVAPSAEVCGDGMDNNCDGQIDDSCGSSDGTPCDDGNVCTHTDAYLGGVCTGSYEPATTVCNVSSGLCGSDSYCDGAGACVYSPPVAAGTECSAAQQCMFASVCDGVNDACPAAGQMADSTSCSEGAFPGTCSAGSCIPF